MALTLLISIILLALCIAGMAISILVKRNGRFPITEIGANPHMRKLGLRCAKEEASEQCSSCSLTYHQSSHEHCSHRRPPERR
ncbi:MAG: hypothetical protein FWD56_00285 [Bacteroidales bacterium]|nr:hypothetical protein [Bacteroidales bacterium]